MTKRKKQSEVWGDSNLGRKDDNWAPGANEKNEVVFLTLEEARLRIIERNAEEALDAELAEIERKRAELLKREKGG